MSSNGDGHTRALVGAIATTALDCGKCPALDCPHAAELLEALTRYAWATGQERLARAFLDGATLGAVPFPGLEALIREALELGRHRGIDEEEHGTRTQE